MVDNTSAPTTVGQGTPVTIATTVQPTHMPTVPINPLMTMDNWTPLIVMVAALAGIIGLFTKHIAGKIGDFKEVHKGTHETLDIKIASLEHKVAGERTRINALELFRNADIERIVKLETNLHNIEQSQARIEHALEKMAVDLGGRIDSWATAMTASIREVREVKPRN